MKYQGLAHEEDVDGFMLGNFTYDQHSQETLQIFHIEVLKREADIFQT